MRKNLSLVLLTRHRGYKTFFMLNSAEFEMLINIEIAKFDGISTFILLIIVGILTFMSRINFDLS